MEHAYLIDACSLLNLVGSRRCEEVLRTLPGACAIVHRVADEAVYVFRGGGGSDAHERESVELQRFTESGLLTVIGLASDDEAETFVALAAQLDDGEALTCALAIHRGSTVVTDDGKALKLLRERCPQVSTLATSQVMKRWADSVQSADPQVQAALLDIHERARFTPPRSDPLFEWWRALVSGDVS